MIKLTWLQMGHPEFQMAMDAINTCPNLDGHTSYRASRIYSEIAKANSDIKDFRVKLIDKHAKKDETGKPVSDETGKVLFDTDESEELFRKEFLEEFEKHSIEIKVKKLDFEHLTQVRGLTPKSWEHIAPIVENLPSDEPEEELETKEGSSNLVHLPTRKS